MKVKTCRDCNCSFPETSEFFHYQNKKIGRFVSYCKTCKSKRDRVMHRNYYLKNRDEVLRKKKAYQKENKEIIKKRKQSYYQKNKERILEQQKEYGNNPEVKARKSRWVIERRDADPSYKMAMNVSRCVRMGIKKGNGVKEYSTWKALPYTPQQLREHIENQFEEWMSWDNYGTGEGKWNIDHIIPQSKLRYDSLDHPNFQKCWALENLRPMCSIENIRKSDK
jgi:uncharacterized protein (DUF2249 family)